MKKLISLIPLHPRHCKRATRPRQSIQASAPECTGLPRFARNDEGEVNGRHYEPEGRGNPLQTGELECTGLPCRRFTYPCNDARVVNSRHCELQAWQSTSFKCPSTHFLPQNQQSAFSLIELLVSLIIISLITASFAPVLTKKIKKEAVTFTNNKNNISEISKECSEINKNCKLCFEDKCLSCSDGCILENGNCKCWSEPDSQEDCKKYNAVFISKTFNGTNAKGLCVSKRNIGDDGGPNVYFGVVSKVKTGGETCSTQGCCWTDGPTAVFENSSFVCVDNPSTIAHGSNYSPFDYQSCKRAVCNYSGAYESCKNYAPDEITRGLWRLPSENEAYGWIAALSSETSVSSAKINRYLGAAGLQLCNGYSTQGTTRCYGYRNCKSANEDFCHAYDIWVETSSGSDCAYNIFYGGDSADMQCIDRQYALSSRCVLDKVLK